MCGSLTKFNVPWTFNSQDLLIFRIGSAQYLELGMEMDRLGALSRLRPDCLPKANVGILIINSFLFRSRALYFESVDPQRANTLRKA